MHHQVQQLTCRHLSVDMTTMNHLTDGQKELFYATESSEFRHLDGNKSRFIVWESHCRFCHKQILQEMQRENKWQVTSMLLTAVNWNTCCAWLSESLALCLLLMWSFPVLRMLVYKSAFCISSLAYIFLPWKFVSPGLLCFVSAAFQYVCFN